MRFGAAKKVLREDVKGAGSWVSPLLDALNSLIENVYVAMNKNVSFQDNVACQIKEISYTTPSTYPSGVDTIEFTSLLRTKAVGLMLMQVYDKADYTPPPGPVYVPWVEINGSIIISTITGLEANKSYLVRVLLS